MTKKKLFEQFTLDKDKSLSINLSSKKSSKKEKKTHDPDFKSDSSGSFNDKT